MAKLSKEQWAAVRIRWENDPRDNFKWLSDEIGVSRQGISKHACAQSWKKVANKVAEKSCQVVTTHIDSDIALEKNATIKLATKVNHGGARQGSGMPKSDKTLLKLTIKERAAAHGDDAIAIMVEIMKDTEVQPQIRLAACDKLLDRGFGKPKQESDINVGVSIISDAILDKFREKNLAITADMALKTKARIEQIKNGALLH